MTRHMIGVRHAHPDNHYGYGSQDFWDAEFRLYNLSREEYFRYYEDQAPRCPHCGVARGMSMGTGDCGCGDYSSYYDY